MVATYHIPERGLQATGDLPGARLHLEKVTVPDDSERGVKRSLLAADVAVVMGDLPEARRWMKKVEEGLGKVGKGLDKDIELERLAIEAIILELGGDQEGAYRAHREGPRLSPGGQR